MICLSNYDPNNSLLGTFFLNAEGYKDDFNKPVVLDLLVDSTDNDYVLAVEFGIC